MNHTQLHQALDTKVIDQHGVSGFKVALVRLQRSKTDVTHSLHVRQTSFNLSGRFTEAHIIHRLGFSHGPCPFLEGECLASPVPEGFNIRAFANMIVAADAPLREACAALLDCGVYIENALFGTGGMGPIPEQMLRAPSGDGHNAAKKERMKDTEDDSFKFVLTWIASGDRDKGWTIHYIPKHTPLSAEVASMLEFLGLRPFPSCPEADFDPCRWRFLRFIAYDHPFHGPAEITHGWFVAHAAKFSRGISKLLEAEAVVASHGYHLLPSVKTNVPAEVVQPPRRTKSAAATKGTSLGTPATSRTTAARPAGSVSGSAAVGGGASPTLYDVAISYAGPQREFAEALAEKVRAAGFEIFYDGFYPEQLWGKDLAVFFDDIYRNKARYCVTLVSREYVERAWTNHERRSAVAKMIELKGQEYILPVKIDMSSYPAFSRRSVTCR